MLAVRTMPVTRSWSLGEDALVAGIAEATHLGPVPLEYDLIASAIPCAIAEELGAVNLEISCAEQRDRGETKLVTKANDDVLCCAGLGRRSTIGRRSSACCKCGAGSEYENYGSDPDSHRTPFLRLDI